MIERSIDAKLMKSFRVLEDAWHVHNWFRISNSWNSFSRHPIDGFVETDDVGDRRSAFEKKKEEGRWGGDGVEKSIEEKKKKKNGGGKKCRR